MAQFKREPSGKWAFRLDIGINPATGKRQQKYKGGFKTKKEAVVAAAKIENELANKTYVADSSITFAQFAEEWLEAYRQGVKLTSAVNREGAIKRLNAKIGSCKLQSITPQQYQKMLLDLSKNYSHRTTTDTHAVAKVIFRQAREYKIINSDPTEFVKPPKEKKTIEQVQAEAAGENLKYMEKEELLRFLDHIKKTEPEQYPLFRLLAYTGMRIGELCALTWQDIDFANNQISITKNVYSSSNKTEEYILQIPKTAQSVRKIEIDEETLSALQQHKRSQNIEKMRQKNVWHDKHDFVFTSPKRAGYPVIRPTILARLKKILRDCGMDTHYTLHSFRHTHTSLLAEAEVPIMEIMDRLGHKDDNTTKHIYMHVTKTQKKRTLERFTQYMQQPL